MKNLLMYLLFAVILISCKETDSSSLSDKEISQLKNDVMRNGSNSSYANLANYYKNSKNFYEILPYNLIMVNKYNYKYGFVSIAENILRLNQNGNFDLQDIKKLNDGDRDLVLFYLEKGSNEGDPESIKILAELYKNEWGVSKDLKRADSLNSIYENMMWGK